jgi:hypothetical protein
MSDNEDFYNSPKFRAMAEAKRSLEETLPQDDEHVQRKVSDAITDVVGVNYIEGGALHGEITNNPEALLDDVIVTMRHARIFITSREKMHPTGIELYDELLEKLIARSVVTRPHGASHD